MRCSKRWAKPVLPGFSFFEPTWYQTFTAAIGALWSSWTIRVRPLPSTYFWNGTSGIGMSADAASAVAGRPARTRAARRFRVMGSPRARRPQFYALPRPVHVERDPGLEGARGEPDLELALHRRAVGVAEEDVARVEDVVDLDVDVHAVGAQGREPLAHLRVPNVVGRLPG